MKKIKSGTIVFLCRNPKVIGTVVRVSAFSERSLPSRQGQTAYSVLWFGRTKVNHWYDKDEIAIL